MDTIDVYRIILLISHLALLFFLSLLICKTKSDSSSSSSFDTHKHKHKHTHTDAQTCKSTTTKTQIPEFTQHRPTITIQPLPPPKPVKTMETQNTTKIKPDLPKIHQKPVAQTQKINLKLNYQLKTHNPNQKSKYKLNGGKTLEIR